MSETGLKDPQYRLSLSARAEQRGAARGSLSEPLCMLPQHSTGTAHLAEAHEATL